ncbi:MAG: hypothetical protein A3I07_03945 [Candidatus Doudnabacteria bacterium RIFCSPLOWO2_02_FULL_42_9]|uniref:Uncharacterized protein n=1 Tax=Candidatus Doudnabacteria bacterium RIFCSPHIGHO2_01_FULL_41_86 TaxID=1817821 RepID=A0A1F5N7S2_9BACT|nr:MAG: hypothetical protein A2717_03400 [Candidatus Doudnabacteria bacterium RIFCSPHIGHO2_01_FULL_41_86]OGE75662.1 MAG: hypothetical protein A3K07_00290 [Candidatus Doudnabacteria bacterium RIFCSPHIGHO2_01_43_10]OGE85690.1 MAG: hypothetical protein A3E28_02730 [Candidatus Doudnabacteria bacterium RIFCSPHIGHO2_12_FULL_42_22]OGE87185.1 MAG: hypothetical protein A3C49_00360 [Candidatus Doudnabacteria bacterium RIFCSPHIGHO2_02_FULL_42_25]OGE92023.1 MAG: hypothetical protein A2895_00235 [Candidatus
MKNIKWLLIVFWSLEIGFSPLQALAQAVPDSAFNPGLIIPDEAFADVGTFGSAAGIQSFLELKGSVLANTTPEFLIKLKEADTLTKVGLEDPQPNLTRLRTAAELIYDAGAKWGLNPQVILVILQKEQSLIAGTFNSDSSLQRALDRSLGFGCPDYEGCGDIFLGFYRQLFGTFDGEGNRWLGAAASLMRSFRAEVGGARVGRGPMVDAQNTTYGRPVVRTARVGDSITLDNTLNGYSGVQQQQTVTLGNYATAALYRYTPHVYNGNYNFWKFYSTWFKYPNGTVIIRVGDIQQYVIDNGTKRPFSAFVAGQRGIKTANVIIVSQTEFDSYPTEKQMVPLEGTLLKGDIDATTYVIGDGVKHPISAPVFAQRKLLASNVMILPQAEVDSYATGSYETPTDGTLIMSETNPTVYIIDTGLKRPISGAVFVARKYSFGKIMKLSDVEVSSMASGPFLTPPNMVALKTPDDPTIWWFRDNSRRGVTAFVWKQRGVGFFPLLTVSSEELMAIPNGGLFPPRDGTVIKGDQSSAIYKMENGLKRMYTAASYKRARYPKPTILPQGDVDGFPAGEIIN